MSCRSRHKVDLLDNPRLVESGCLPASDSDHGFHSRLVDHCVTADIVLEPHEPVLRVHVSVITRFVSPR